jgi:hypothetical protein
MDLNFKLNNICRICLGGGKMRTLESQADESSTTYKHKILQCLNIEVKELLRFVTPKIS